MARIVTIAGNAPQVDPDAFLADDVVVAGQVTIAAGASLWFGVVVRSEAVQSSIGRDSNLQDGVVGHADPGFPLTIGDRVTIGHRAIVHGCTIEDDALIGMGAVVLNGAVVGAGALVGAGAVVTEGMVIPPNTAALGVPAKVRDGIPVPPIPRPNVANYVALADLYRDAGADRPAPTTG